MARRVNKTYLQITDDFSNAIPVLGRELDAIETYLGALMDEMLHSKE